MSLPCNPALPLLAVLAVAGPVAVAWRPAGAGTLADRGRGGRRWRELGIPWAVLGLAGIGLLAPALALPTGIPSPAAALAAVPPWQAAAPAAAGAERGNPLLRDVTFQIQPWLLFARRELRAGRLPAWNPHQFAGSPFWANGQSAPLFPLHLLFAALPLQLGFVLLPWLRLVIGGCGVWMLARELDLGPLAALLAALTFALSGMPVSFALFPMGNALALVPWVLWAVERVAAAGSPSGAPAADRAAAVAGHAATAGAGHAATAGADHAATVKTMLPAAGGLAAAAGLQLLAGHPETAAHTALLSLIYLAVRGGGARPVAAWLGWAAGWLGAAALAAVQLLPLALFLPQTARWQQAPGGAEPPLALLLQQPLRLVLPELYGHPARGTWWGPFNYSATAVYAGALALPLAAAGLARVFRGRAGAAPDGSFAAAALPVSPAGAPPPVARSVPRDRRWLALAVAAAFAFAAAYHLPGVRDLLAALPVLGRAAPHRLLFGVELGLALFAGAGCDEWLAGRGRGILAGATAAVAALAAAWALHHGAWAAHGLLGVEAGWTAAVAAAALLLALSLRLDRGWRYRLAPLLPALALCDLLAAHGAINPGLPLARLYPATGAVRFLAGQAGRVAGEGEALRPNAAMVYGLSDPRGDDPAKLARYEAVYRRFAAGDPVYFQPVARWSSPWLDRLGVRWVVAGPREAARAPGWRLAYAGADARVYERPTALPLVRWAPEAGEAAGPAGSEADGGPGRAGAGAPFAAGDTASAGGGIEVPAAPSVLRREPGRWRIAWSSARPRLLVVAETWAPGWQAWVDGQPRRVEAAAGVLLGVRLGPGAGRVDLRYRPPGLVAGSAVSAAGLLTLVAVPVAGRRQRRRPRQPAGGRDQAAAAAKLAAPASPGGPAVLGSKSGPGGPGGTPIGIPVLAGTAPAGIVGTPTAAPAVTGAASDVPAVTGASGEGGGTAGRRTVRRGYVVRPTLESDLPGVSDLFEESFGNPLLPDEWAWKYRGLPGVARSMVAVDPAGTVLAHAGCLRLAARWRGGEAGIWQLVDYAGRAGGGSLRPPLVALGRQLVADLPDEAAGDVPWVFGFPSERHHRLGELVFGYRPLGFLAALAGPLPEPPPGAAGGVASPAARGTTPPSAAQPPPGQPAPGEDAASENGLWSGDSCGDWAEAIWERCSVLGVRRSAAFLNWRYWARPRRYYRFYRLWQQGVEGLAVFAFVGEEAWATELWLPPAGGWYAPMLAIAADLRAAGLRRWRFWPPPDATAGAPATFGTVATVDSSIGGLLVRLGVRPDGEPRLVTCRGAIHGTVDPVAAAGDFFYAMGDYDLA